MNFSVSVDFLAILKFTVDSAQGTSDRIITIIPTGDCKKIRVPPNRIVANKIRINTANHFRLATIKTVEIVWFKYK